MSASILAAFEAAVKLALALKPVIEDAIKTGTITPEEQARVRVAYESLKNKDAGQFQGEHWKV